MLNNLTKALQPYNIKDFADIEITPNQFSVKIIEANAENQQYNVRVASFAKACKTKHVAFSQDKDERLAFYNDLYARKITDDTLSFLVNVLVVDWVLLDDSDNQVPFDEETAISVLSSMPRIASKLIGASITTEVFVEELLKNS